MPGRKPISVPRTTLVLAAAVVFAAHRAVAADTLSPSGKPLVVAVVETPPFAVAEPGGSWSGLGVDLWSEIAESLHLQWQPKPVNQADAGALLRDHAVDAAIGAVAITAEGERNHDYSQSYLSAGLGIAERSRPTLSWSELAETSESSEILKLVIWVTFAVVVVGATLALIERRRNPGEFGGPLSRDLATGVWWAAAVMTTVGDDKATPKTRFGRTLAFLWMFLGVAVLTYVTATITARLTVGALHENVRSVSDLYRLRLGAVAGSVGADFLNDRHIACTTFPSYHEALTALAGKSIDAALGPLPVLRYQTSRDWQGVLRASSLVLEPVFYAFGLPEDSPLREPVNRELLRITESDGWKDIEARYLGRHD